MIRGEPVYALWEEIVFSGGTHGGETFFARSTDGGEQLRSAAEPLQPTNSVGKGRLGSRQDLLMDKLSITAAGKIVVVNATSRKAWQSRLVDAIEIALHSRPSGKTEHDRHGSGAID